MESHPSLPVDMPRLQADLREALNERSAAASQLARAEHRIAQLDRLIRAAVDVYGLDLPPELVKAPPSGTMTKHPKPITLHGSETLLLPSFAQPARDARRSRELESDMAEALQVNFLATPSLARVRKTKDAVLLAMMTDEDRTWSVEDIVASMLHLGWVPPSANPEAVVRTALSRLSNDSPPMIERADKRGLYRVRRTKDDDREEAKPAGHAAIR